MKNRKAPKQIEVGQYEYLERPPMTTSAEERLVTASYSKLLFLKTGPFRLIEVMPTTVTIDKDGTRNTVPVDWAPVAPAANKTPTEDQRMQSDKTEAKREETYAGDMRLEEKSVANALLEYAVDRTVHSIRKVITSSMSYPSTCKLTIR